MHVLLLGPPGSGKGTQAKLISERYSIPSISMGNELRKIAAKKTKIGKMVKKTIDGGNLVPDELTMNILKKRLKSKDCENGFILDGFPRDIKQAKLLVKITHVDHVFYLHVPDKLLLKRLCARKQCKKCGSVFGLEVKANKKCNNCGGELYQRDDDKTKAIKIRLKVFRKSTIPVVKFYSKMGKIRNVNGDRKTGDIFLQIRKVLR